MLDFSIRRRGNACLLEWNLLNTYGHLQRSSLCRLFHDNFTETPPACARRRPRRRLPTRRHPRALQDGRDGRASRWSSSTEVPSTRLICCSPHSTRARFLPANVPPRQQLLEGKASRRRRRPPRIRAQASAGSPSSGQFAAASI